MQIEDNESEESVEVKCCWKCLCCKKVRKNPDFNKTSDVPYGTFVKKPYFETGHFTPIHERHAPDKTLEEIRKGCAATKNLPSPLEAIERNNDKGEPKTSGKSTTSLDMSDVNTLLRRRLSLRVLVTEDSDKSRERGEALLPRQSNFTEATPILLSHLVKSEGMKALRSARRPDGSDRIKSSIAISRGSKTSLTSLAGSSESVNLEQKNDKEFIEYLVQASEIIRETLEKDFGETKGYIRWIESYIRSDKYKRKAQESAERWMVVLYTSSEDSNDQLNNFRCMLVRLLLQHHCIVYEERDITLPQYQDEFEDRLLGDTRNVPQVFMQGLNVGGYRVIYGIHKLNLIKSIFKKYILSKEDYADWMFKRENNKVAQLTLEVNLKAFPALQLLAGSWSNDKLAPHHLEFVTMGKNVVKRARETWYALSAQPYTEPDLRRYTLLRLTIIHTLFAMNKVYKQYLNKIEPEKSNLKRKLSWLPKISKQVSKD